MIWMFLVHRVTREIRIPNTKPRREPPNATTKKETSQTKAHDVKCWVTRLDIQSTHLLLELSIGYFLGICVKQHMQLCSSTFFKLMNITTYRFLSRFQLHLYVVRPVTQRHQIHWKAPEEKQIENHISGCIKHAVVRFANQIIWNSCIVSFLFFCRSFLDPLIYFPPPTQFNHMFLASRRLKPACFISA